MPMNAETSRAELILPNEPRMFGAVAAIVSHAAERVGFSEKAQKGLAEAAIEACEQALALAAEDGNAQPRIHVIVENFDDRVEITLEHHGVLDPTAGLDSFVAGGKPGGGKLSAALQGTGVDRVQYEAGDGLSRTRLIKYAEGKAPRN